MSTPTPQDFAIARLSNQRGHLENVIDQLNAKVAELEAEKSALADRLAAVMAEGAAAASPTVEVETITGEVVECGGTVEEEQVDG